MDLHRELHLIVDHLLGDDPRRALTAYGRLEAELPWLLRRAFAIARADGWSDERICRFVPEQHNGPEAVAPGPLVNLLFGASSEDVAAANSS